MATQLQPQNMANPNQNVLIVLSPDTKCILTEENRNEASHYITPLEFQELRKSGWVNNDCILRENMVLQLDPIHKRYTELTTSKNNEIIKDRIDSVHLILQQLGAKSVYIKQELQKGSKKTINSNAHAEASTLTGGNCSIDGSYNSGHGANYEYVKDTNVQYSGYYTRQSYNKAIELSKEYGWDTDSYIQSILYQRNPDHKNHLDKTEMRFKLREDLQNNMDVAVKLQSNCKGFNVDIDGNWKKDEESTKNEQYHILVEFGPLVDGNENSNTTIHQLPDNLPVLPPSNTNTENNTAFVSDLQNDLQKQFESFEGQFGNADIQISVLHDNIDKLDKQQKEVKKEHSEKIEQLDSSVSSLLKRTDDIEDFVAQIGEWGEAVDTRTRIDNLQTAIETANSNLASTKEELSTHIDKLQKEIEIAEINNKLMKRKLIWLACILQTTIETQQKEHSEKIEQLDTSVSSLLKRTDDIEEFAAQIGKWEEAIDTRIDNLEITNSNLTSATEELVIRIDNLQTAIETANSNLTSATEELNTRINNLQIDIDLTGNEFASAKEELTTHIDRLQQEIEAAETNNKSIKRKLIWLACIMAVFCAVTIVTTILVSIAYYEYF